LFVLILKKVAWINMTVWAKNAADRDILIANSICKEKQSAEKAATAKWWRPYEILILPYLNGDINLVRIIQGITLEIKDYWGPTGWAFKDGKFQGIKRGSKVVCTKSNIGHVGYVQYVEGEDITFHILTLNNHFSGYWQTIQSDWGLTVLPDHAVISKQMTATEALRHLHQKHNPPAEEKVEEPTLALPEVTNLSWGVIKVKHSGETLSFKDAKLYPGQATAWDWGITGTHHNPGIQYEDIREILDSGVDHIILSKGQYGNLGITNGLTEQIAQENVAVHVAETEEAVELYESLRKQGVNVGIIIHSTC